MAVEIENQEVVKCKSNGHHDVPELMKAEDAMEESGPLGGISHGSQGVAHAASH